ncbi:MAG: peptide-methionine (S)-S-oxide reductase MsrA [Erythrobacter sp.]
MRALPALAVITLALSACSGPLQAAEELVNAPVAKRLAKEEGLQTAIFAGGCFWGVEGVFSHVKGVTAAVSGYHGGSAATAKYNMITAGGTAHAESVKVTYDPAVIRYDELLRIFFSVVADPTLKNRQGPDVGSHYRSALVPTTPEQKKVAEAYLAQLEAAKLWPRPIVTRIEPLKTFYPAESYHQDFMAKNPRHGYILRWDKPKVEALKTLFPSHYRANFLRDAG